MSTPLCVALSVGVLAVTASAQITTRISVDSLGGQSNGLAGTASISADGRFVAFYGNRDANNLVAGDTNNCSDVFIHDRELGRTTRVSVDSLGVQGNADSWRTAISADGRCVAFLSQASNLVPGDTNNLSDIFVHDRLTRPTTRVTVDSAGAQANSGHDNYPFSISGDGRLVTFTSRASNLVPGDTNNREDVFVHDIITGQTTRVSVSSSGVQGDSGSSHSSISADGMIVSFESLAGNFHSGTPNSYVEIFVHDRQTGQTSLISINSSGLAGNNPSSNSKVSADGSCVVFSSHASNLISGDTNDFIDVFVHDRRSGQTTRVSVNSNGGQQRSYSSNYLAKCAISSDGRYVAFESGADNLVPGDTNHVPDIFLHDRHIGTTLRASVSSDGIQAIAASWDPSISGIGPAVAFESSANNLVVGDTGGRTDVVGHERCNPLAVHPQTVLASAGAMITFTLDFDQADAGSHYKLLGSATGVGPTNQGGIDIPLSRGDWLWRALHDAPGPRPFQDHFGVLDTNGDATCTLSLAPSMSAPLAGSTLYFAAGLYTPQGGGYLGIKATNPVTLTVLP